MMSPKSLRRIFLFTALAPIWAATQTAAAGEPARCYDGCWASFCDKFHGTVRARIQKCDETRYIGHFEGRAFKIMPFKYTSTLHVTHVDEDGRVHFKATDKLGIWGCYWTSGYFDDCKFYATYRTDDNCGKYVMKRVGCCCKGRKRCK